MRFSLLLALALAGSMTAAAQKYEKPKAKPAHNADKQPKSQGTVKLPQSHSSSAQELRRVEQSGVKASGPRKGQAGKAPRPGTVRKAEKKEQNPPIKFATAGGHMGKGSKGVDPAKGRLRHKGSH